MHLNLIPQQNIRIIPTEGMEKRTTHWNLLPEELFLHDIKYKNKSLYSMFLNGEGIIQWHLQNFYTGRNWPSRSSWFDATFIKQVLFSLRLCIYLIWLGKEADRNWGGRNYHWSTRERVWLKIQCRWGQGEVWGHVWILCSEKILPGHSVAISLPL